MNNSPSSPQINLAVIDAHNHLHKYHHKVPEEATLCYSWGSMLSSLIRDLNLNGAVAVFDPLVKEPKPGRKPTPERIARDQPDIQRICEAVGIPAINPSELLEEGDQLVADICYNLPFEKFERMWGEHTLNVYIVSSDKDFAQLVTTEKIGNCSLNVRLVRREDESWKIYDEPRVLSKWGVRPDQIVDYLTLVGDSTDGIPGVKGIGEKTAAAILTVYGSIQNLLLKSSGLSADDFIEKFRSGELVLNPVPSFTQTNANNMSYSLPFIAERRAMIELTPRRLQSFPNLFGTTPNITKTMMLLGSFGLSDMAAKLAEGRLWRKTRQITEKKPV